MMFSRLRYFVIILYFLVLYPFGDIEAFDGNRKGFFLGVGIEPGISAYRTVYYADSHLYGKPSVTLNYKIGYASSEQLLIYFTVRSSLDGGYTYNFEEGNFNHNSFDLASDGTFGMGFMIFPNQVNNFYFSGCFGLGTAINLDYFLVKSSGFGMSGGVGYEIFPNLAIGITLDYRSLTYVGGYEADMDVDVYYYPVDEDPADDLVTFSLAINFLFY